MIQLSMTDLTLKKFIITAFIQAKEDVDEKNGLHGIVNKVFFIPNSPLSLWSFSSILADITIQLTNNVGQRFSKLKGPTTCKKNPQKREKDTGTE